MILTIILLIVLFQIVRYKSDLNYKDSFESKQNVHDSVLHRKILTMPDESVSYYADLRAFQIPQTDIQDNVDKILKGRFARKQDFDAQKRYLKHSHQIRLRQKIKDMNIPVWYE